MMEHISEISEGLCPWLAFPHVLETQGIGIANGTKASICKSMEITGQIRPPIAVTGYSY